MGYEMRVEPGRVRFGRRSTYGVMIGALVSGGLVFIVAINGFIQLFLALPVGIGLLVGAGALGAGVFMPFHRRWRRRSNLEMEQLPGFIVDLQSWTWFDHTGQRLASCDEVVGQVRYDLTRRTFNVEARIGSRREVRYADYAFSRAHAEEVMHHLGRLGVFCVAP